MNDLQTTANATALLAQIEKYQARVFRFGKHKGRSPAVKKIKQAAKAAGIDLKNQTQTQIFLFGLKEKISKLPVVEVTLAFPPHPELEAKISRWVKKWAGPAAIAKIVVEPAILAGVQLSFNGYWQDLSVRKKLTKVLEKEKKAIIKKFKIN